MKKHVISLLSILFMVLLGKLFISSAPSAEGLAYQELFNSRYKVFALNLPDKLAFAGERVPLEIEDVSERLDRELHVNTYWQSNTLLMIKRANRYFPIIRPILKRYGIPDDFKYLPLVESNFVDMVSPAGAVGPWQFLPETARSYGLEVNNNLDERYHITKSTVAACKYLRDAYREFGNWTLVAASYNVGVTAIRNALSRQRVKTYYDMDLNTQTSRYVFRMLAIKDIMEHPAHYGFQFRKYHLYQPFSVHELTVDSSITNLPAFALGLGINLKILRELNPWLQTDKLINPSGKTYVIQVPKVKSPSYITVEEDTPVYDVVIPVDPFLDSLK